MEKEQRILEEFLNMPAFDHLSVFKKFTEEIENAMYYPESNGSDDFVYIPGTREDRILILAHADTVFDATSDDRISKPRVTCYRDGNVYHSASKYRGFGADDRAGCAMAYLLADMGHSILITNGEEVGSAASFAIEKFHRELFDELNSHNYMLELDRQGLKEYKTYNLPVSKDFANFIEQKTGYSEPNKYSYTDIVWLCRDICGVNLSIGYYNEHTSAEILNYDEWLYSYRVVKKMLKAEQPKFPLVGKNKLIEYYDSRKYSSGV